jgi:hypothetical protein
MSDGFMEAWVIEEEAPVIKSPAQGAATTVWASIAADDEGMRDNELEDCSVAKPFVSGNWAKLALGCFPHAYDEGTARNLWDVSSNLVGLEDSGLE